MPELGIGAAENGLDDHVERGVLHLAHHIDRLAGGHRLDARNSLLRRGRKHGDERTQRIDAEGGRCGAALEFPVLALSRQQPVAKRGADELLLELRFPEDVGMVEKDRLHVLGLAEIMEGAADPLHAMIRVLVHGLGPDMERIGDHLQEPAHQRQRLLRRDHRLRHEIRRGQRIGHGAWVAPGRDGVEIGADALPLKRLVLRQAQDEA